MLDLNYMCLYTYLIYMIKCIIQISHMLYLHIYLIIDVYSICITCDNQTISYPRQYKSSSI